MKKLFIISLMFAASLTTYAQDSRPNSLVNNAASVKVENYVCVLHPEVIDDRPGKCFICGDDLILLKKAPLKTDLAKIYTCPMHPDITSNKPGKCTVCGMELSVPKPAQTKSSR
ncbi:MAG: hypothetical protein JWP81_4329 [Ferruginibacter sp.]|nr:hypothetical protein [Ferruginibacter sp.]